MTRIAFLALAQAHQDAHFLPAAFALARTSGVTVDVVSASRANLAFITGLDPEGLLHPVHVYSPSLRRDGLFTPPPRGLALLRLAARLSTYDAIVTTETSSSLLKRLGLRVPLIEIKHGMGDREGGYKKAHGRFDLILVAGEKDRRRLIERGLGTAASVVVAGYAKFEMIAINALAAPMTALYNPHFDRDVSSWFQDGAAMVNAMGQLSAWRFVIAPHVKLRGGRDVGTVPDNVTIDYGSAGSIDMRYTNAASVYIGDASSQVYEFIRTPRPCIFINSHRVDWHDDPAYAHWKLGQVIESPAELGAALSRVDALQPSFAALQRKALADAADTSPELASTRQARAILAFLAGR